MNWPELIVFLKKVLDHVDITEQQAIDMSNADRAKSIQHDLVTCACYFDYRFKELKKTWKSQHEPFGNKKINEYYYRAGFQQGGNPHVHMMLWLQDVPVLNEINGENEIACCN